jgi:predicted Zn-ribbon and HTH transcriptional regulator
VIKGSIPQLAKLIKKQMATVSEKIIWLLKDQGYVPLKYREIGRRIGEKYPQTVKSHIEKLEKDGKVHEKNGLICLTANESQFLIMPVYSI